MTQSAAAQFTLPLPASYRLDDVLAFHRRDAESVAEQVSARQLRKGMLLDGVPVVLEIALNLAPDMEHDRAHTGARSSATCTVLADGPCTPAIVAYARAAADAVLGLRIDPQPFAEFTAADPLFGPLTRAQAGLRVVQSATVFEALTWAIIGQQINLPFAIALRRTFILQAGRQHSSGLWCYPDASSAAKLGPDVLTTRKFSRAKAETVLRLAQLVASGELRLALGPDYGIEEVSAALLAVKGIGPWTVNYGLLRGYGYADCSLHGDVAVRAALQRLLGEQDKPDLARTEQFLARYRPHRTMAAAHLWASLHPPANGQDTTPQS
ncbi:DNA-3-methyladenine glycosylase 2 [Rugamonas apoptosis]|uniref:DNA-3-methyladenine glycosylase II n=1 Tax=Rugamonas apoptosis TaxID=2758570 RepID=A0A7W2IJ82_9BURK|nr:DNA-3-methyladenine glycosylase 2 [Rugamonas apoptosis]MBA5686490.1 DNA-3-methyladenine glycosylase 2 [Rugamonas apoptosis]